MYLSYPALYTHSKTKHPEHAISSKGKEEIEGNAPVKKLKSILNSQNSPREELERSLLKISKVSSLQMYKSLSQILEL